MYSSGEERNKAPDRGMKFICRSCGLVMFLDIQPPRCFDCDSGDISRERWDGCKER